VDDDPCRLPFSALSHSPAWHGYATRDDFARVHVLFEDSDWGPLCQWARTL